MRGNRLESLLGVGASRDSYQQVTYRGGVRHRVSCENVLWLFVHVWRCARSFGTLRLLLAAVTGMRTPYETISALKLEARLLEALSTGSSKSPPKLQHNRTITSSSSQGNLTRSAHRPAKLWLLFQCFVVGTRSALCIASLCMTPSFVPSQNKSTFNRRADVFPITTTIR